MEKLGRKTPKALLRVAGKPILEYQLQLLQSSGFTNVLILTSHLGEHIEKFCKERIASGLTIRCLRERTPLGTAGALKAVQRYLPSDFLVLYGDEMVQVDLKRFIRFHRDQRRKYPTLAGTLAVHPNDHPMDSNLVEIDNNNRIQSLLTKPHPPELWFRNLVSTPLYALTPKVFKYIPNNTPSDLGRDTFPHIVRGHKNVLVAYPTPEYLKDVGTPKRLREVATDVRNGVFGKMSLRHKRPAIFLDRDGVINKEVGDLRHLQDFELLPGVTKAVRKINQSGYLAVVISNQPVVAKGFCTFDDVLHIHKKMETLLGREGAKLDAIYFCPHHPDNGFPGENMKYKIACRCRKPKTGMIQVAVKDLNIDLQKSIVIGDRTGDAKLGENLGIRFLGVKTGEALRDNAYELKQKPRIAKSLLTAVNALLKARK